MSVNNAETPVFNDGIIKDSAGGIAQFEITSGMLSKPGDFPCEFLLTGPSSPPLKANGLTLRVDASSLESAEQSTNEYSSLIIALNRVDAAAAQAEQTVQAAQNAADTANDAAALANKASTIIYSSVNLDPLTGALIMQTPDGYLGPDFALNDGKLEVNY
jgi:hypothetical protein